MSGRPTKWPRWAFNAPFGAVVDPPVGVAGAGWSTGTKPPAQYLNALFNQYGAWISFLSGPDTGTWTRRAHGAGASLLFPVAGGGNIDTDQISADTVAVSRFRYVILGNDTNTLALTVRCSTRGHEYVARANFPGVPGVPMRVRFFPSLAHPEGKWWVCTQSAVAVVGTLYWTWPDDATHAGASAVQDSGVNWTATAGWPVGFTHVNDIAGDPLSNKMVAACGRTLGPFSAPDAAAAEGLVESFDGGTTWTAAGLAVATAHGFTSVACNNGYFVAVTENNEIYTAPPGAAVWQQAMTWATPATGMYRVAAGRVAGEFILYNASGHTGAGAQPLLTPQFRYSTNNGATWSTPATPTTMRDVLEMRVAEGVVYAVQCVAPFAWESSDLTTWAAMPLPYDETISIYDPATYNDWRLLGLCYGDGALVFSQMDWTVRSGTARAPAAGTWSPDLTPATYTDAGYLRGYRVSSTAPSATGQVLTWNAATSQWVPSAGPITTRGDLFVGGAAGAPSRLAIGGAHAVLSTDGTDLGWRTISSILDAALGDTRGMVLVRGSSDWQALPLGAAGEVLTSDGTDVAWAAPAGGSSNTDAYTFDTADGLTLAPDPSPGGAGETAAVTGGALVLTIPAGVRRDYSAGAQQSPYATVSLLSEGCAPLALRAQARVAFSSTGSRVGCWAHFVLRAASGERVQLKVTWRDNWQGQATVLTFDANGTVPTIVGAFPGTTSIDPGLHDGRLYLRLVVFGRWVVGYYGIGSLGPVAPPSTWVELGRVGLTTAAGLPLQWTDLRLVGSHESVSNDGAITITWDDLTITVEDL